MLETPHVAVGVAIATKFPNPWIAIPLSFASHFVLDRIPHWNPHLYTETKKSGKPSKQSTRVALLDIALALILGSSFAWAALPDWKMALLILACSLSSVLSDAVKYPYYYLKMRSKFMVAWVNFERSLQVDTKGVFWGVVTQGLVILVSVWWAIN